MEVTHREKTEEELKAIEEARKTKGIWMGEAKPEDVTPPEPKPSKFKRGKERLGFMGFNNDTEEFTLFTDAVNINEVHSGTRGDLDINKLRLEGTLNVSGSTNLANILNVSGITTLESHFSVGETATIRETLSVGDAVIFESSLSVGDGTFLESSLSVGGGLSLIHI